MNNNYIIIITIIQWTSNFFSGKFFRKKWKFQIMCEWMKGKKNVLPYLLGVVFKISLIARTERLPLPMFCLIFFFPLSFFRFLVFHLRIETWHTIMKRGSVGFTVQVGISEINISFGLSIITISSMTREKKILFFFLF